MADRFQLYDTRRRAVAPIEPIEPGKIRMYTCGPTVYGQPSIGNYRTYITQDALVRSLRRFGYEVTRVMNVTDVGHLTSDGDEGEDKLEVGARREGLTAWEVAARYERLFLDDLDRLALERPGRLVRATETVEAQIRLIQALEAKGATYRLSDGLYFDASTFPEYPELGRLDLAGQEAGARVEVVHGKRHPYDFALWKFSPEATKRDMEWTSPWGVGFPGWHIECSAIALQELGPELDIHGGGVDHIPVHHTNEIAQSQTATGKPLARHWNHAEFLLIDGGKMSKSLGNVYTLDDLAERGIEPLDFKFFTYSAHYRSKLNFTWEAVASARDNLRRLRHLLRQGGQAGEDADIVQRFEQALATDLNLPLAMAALWELGRADIPADRKQSIAGDMDSVLGLDLLRTEAAEVPEAVKDLAAEREAARAAKDWARSDRLREEIEKLGFSVADTAEGTVLEPKPLTY